MHFLAEETFPLYPEAARYERGTYLRNLKLSNPTIATIIIIIVILCLPYWLFWWKREMVVFVHREKGKARKTCNLKGVLLWPVHLHADKQAYCLRGSTLLVSCVYQQIGEKCEKKKKWKQMVLSQKASPNANIRVSHVIIWLLSTNTLLFCTAVGVIIIIIAVIMSFTFSQKTTIEMGKIRENASK